jgi:iron complex transport system ATP-binding protein
MNALLHVENVAWRASGIPILERVTFDAAKGELVALMGRNGAGKSTLLDLLARLRRPAEGTVVLEGRPLDAWTSLELARTVAHLPQLLSAEIPFTAEELVLMGRYPRSPGWLESKGDRGAVERAMLRCDCWQFRRRRLSTLSGGERQRVFLAACLAQEPRVLLLDEPATFLDVDQQLECFRLLRELADDGVLAVAVTHDINLALTFCTRILVLSERTLSRDLPAAAAIEDPEWLSLFSARLGVSSTPGGRPFVWYA